MGEKDNGWKKCMASFWKDHRHKRHCLLRDGNVALCSELALQRSLRPKNCMCVFIVYHRVRKVGATSRTRPTSQTYPNLMTSLASHQMKSRSEDFQKLSFSGIVWFFVTSRDSAAEFPRPVSPSLTFDIAYARLHSVAEAFQRPPWSSQNGKTWAIPLTCGLTSRLVSFEHTTDRLLLQLRSPPARARRRHLPFHSSQRL